MYNLWSADIWSLRSTTHTTHDKYETHYTLNPQNQLGIIYISHRSRVLWALPKIYRSAIDWFAGPSIISMCNSTPSRARDRKKEEYGFHRWYLAFLFWNLIFIYILEIYTYTYTVFATTTTDENIGRRPTRPHHQLLLILCFRLSGCRETNTKDTKNQNPATHHIVLNTQHDHTLYIEFDHIKLRWFVSVWSKWGVHIRNMMKWDEICE